MAPQESSMANDTHSAHVSGESPDVAEKALFRIGEVSRLTGTKAFVLRYWETEFPTLLPVKSPNGHRLYRREDIEAVFEIKRLLYEQGFTIAGARRYLAERKDGARAVSPEDEGALTGGTRTPEALSANNQRLLLTLREELSHILTLLKGR
jgi:DNA-binding transcriptional MerR regulator